jgi:periplasmic protein TonB
MPSLQLRFRSVRTWCAGALLVAIAAGLVGCGEEPEKPRKVATVKLLPDTPPPPPPPPKLDTPPPAKAQDKPEARPEPKPADPTPQALKSDEAAGAGPGSGLAAGNVTQDYQGGPVIAGSGGGNAGAMAASRMATTAWANAATRSLNEYLQREAQLKNSEYRLQVHLWLHADGRVERFDLLGSSGNPQIDDVLRTALQRFPGTQTPPPQALPQPLRLQLSNRNLG